MIRIIIVVMFGGVGTFLLINFFLSRQNVPITLFWVGLGFLFAAVAASRIPPAFFSRGVLRRRQTEHRLGAETGPEKTHTIEGSKLQ